LRNIQDRHIMLCSADNRSTATSQTNEWHYWYIAHSSHVTAFCKSLGQSRESDTHPGINCFHVQAHSSCATDKPIGQQVINKTHSDQSRWQKWSLLLHTFIAPMCKIHRLNEGTMWHDEKKN
jgi:hypothetical protein